MTRDDFIAGYCARSGVTWEWLSQYRDAVPCDCGEERCKGWQMESKADAIYWPSKLPTITPA